MKDERKYLVSSHHHCLFPEEKLLAKQELGTDDVLCLIDCTNEEGNWKDELWSEDDADFPKRIGDFMEEKFLMEDGMTINLVYWFIDVPEIGRGLLLQDASPIGFIFRREDIEKSKLKFEYV